VALIPNLKKIDRLGPLTIPLHNLHAMALSHGEEQFKARGACAPTFLVSLGCDVYWIEDSWASNQERGFKFALMREIIDVMQARAYSFISEVYVATMTVEEVERFGMPTDLPSEMPPDRRDEMLWIDSWDRQGAHYMSRYLITPARPPARQRAFLGPRVDEEHDEMVGRAMNLFQPPKEVIL
jgi:hypothetical protein